MNQENMINIGKITSSVGIKGEVRVTLYAGESDNLVKGAVLTLTAGKAKLVYEVQSVRYQGGRPVVKFAEVPDRTAADTLRNYEIYIPEEALAELGEGEFYIKDLMGFAVYDR
ncbi:MAG: 16S rRNA processing protein RimM, partial [Mogibacterium sp.]|nr:16S rRNA processing protein RimM [Mogibacterium sp.]